MSYLSEEVRLAFEGEWNENSMHELLGPLVHDINLTERVYPSFVSWKNRAVRQITTMVVGMEQYFNGAEFEDGTMALDRTTTYLQSRADTFLYRSLVEGIVMGAYYAELKRMTYPEREAFMEKVLNRPPVIEAIGEFSQDPDLVILSWRKFVHFATLFGTLSGMTEMKGHMIGQIWNFWDIALSAIGTRFFITGCAVGHARREARSLALVTQSEGG